MEEVVAGRDFRQQKEVEEQCFGFWRANNSPFFYDKDFYYLS